MDKPKGDSVRLNEGAARRLIQRATELDASLSTESSVAELREAARGAGISDEAFQRALEEVRSEASAVHAPVKQVGTFAPRKYIIIAAIALALGVMLLRLVVPGGSSRAPAAPVGGAPSVAPTPVSPPPTTPAPIGPPTTKRPAPTGGRPTKTIPPATRRDVPPR